MFDLRSARHWAQELWAEKIEPGMVCVDATMGNGHDTRFLCERVGTTGRVYALDVQHEALVSTRALLEDAGFLDRATLILDGHEHIASYVMEPVDVCVFNLGWLPGGDHQLTTKVETTLRALDAALGLLQPAGLITVCCYPGHAEGDHEREAVIAWTKALPAKRFQARLTSYLNQPENTPLLICISRVR